MYYPSSENKGADQLRSYCEADLRLCFRIGKNPVFSRCGSFNKIVENDMQFSSVIRVTLCYEKADHIRPSSIRDASFLARLYESTGRAIITAVTPASVSALASALASALLKC